MNDLRENIKLVIGFVLNLLIIPFMSISEGKPNDFNQDFLLLKPDQKDLPESSSFRMPIFQQLPTELGASEKATQELRGETKTFENLQELTSVTTNPLYTFDQANLGIKFKIAYVTSFQLDGGVWSVRQIYSSDEGGEITIDAIPIESRPVPVSPALISRKSLNESEYLSDEDYAWAYPEFTKDTPVPGIFQNYGVGYLLMWIQNDVLYIINNFQSRVPTSSKVLLDNLLFVGGR
jgi:hypothetical protein